MYAPTIIAEYLPLKQGLKLCNLLQSHQHSLSAEYLPLKQGVKPRPRPNSHDISRIAEYLPLKQGLKHQQDIPTPYRNINCRIPSTKTRIETHL